MKQRPDLNSDTVHLVVDLETLSCRRNATVASIGLVWFTLDGRYGEFYFPLEWEKQRNRDLDRDTVSWWLEQDDAARAQLTGARHGNREAAERVAALLRSFEPELPSQLLLWGNNPEFDLGILADWLKETLGEHEPFWQFWQERDVRTLEGAVPDLATSEAAAHIAIDDARAEAEFVKNALQVLKRRMGKEGE